MDKKPEFPYAIEQEVNDLLEEAREALRLAEEKWQLFSDEVVHYAAYHASESAINLSPRMLELLAEATGKAVWEIEDNPLWAIEELALSKRK